MIRSFLDYVTTSANWSGSNGIAHRSLEHLRLSFIAVVAAGLLAVPAGVWLGRVRRGGFVAQSIVNIGRAVPSLAILAILFPLCLRWGLGLGFWPTFIALVILAVPPMFTNAYTAIRSVDPSIVEASRGMGMRPLEVLSRVEIPCGLALILTGVRIATLQVIATATLGTYVGFNGLGSFINEGFLQRDNAKLLTGAIAVATSALAVDLLFGVLARQAMPWAPKPSLSKGTEL
ncbi:MAG: ABC transporter permease [Acidimicrobiales bacterium]|nr:ABC transporter permease [Acidimicrobiales bacterium]